MVCTVSKLDAERNLFSPVVYDFNRIEFEIEQLQFFTIHLQLKASTSDTTGGVRINFSATDENMFVFYIHLRN
jgi:hypothetical protein